MLRERLRQVEGQAHQVRRPARRPPARGAAGAVAAPLSRPGRVVPSSAARPAGPVGPVAMVVPVVAGLGVRGIGSADDQHPPAHAQHINLGAVELGQPLAG